jgi:MoxR-like ATPase
VLKTSFQKIEAARELLTGIIDTVPVPTEDFKGR